MRSPRDWPAPGDPGVQQALQTLPVRRDRGSTAAGRMVQSWGGFSQFPKSSRRWSSSCSTASAVVTVCWNGFAQHFPVALAELEGGKPHASRPISPASGLPQHSLPVHRHPVGILECASKTARFSCRAVGFPQLRQHPREQLPRPGPVELPLRRKPDPRAPARNAGPPPAHRTPSPPVRPHVFAPCPRRYCSEA